jgi:hypothetical protein
MEQYVPRAREAIKADPDLASAVFATSGECPLLPGVNRVETGFQCPAFYDYWKALALEPRFSTVAVSANWVAYRAGLDDGSYTYHGRRAISADVDQAWKSFASDLRLLADRGKRVIILIPNPVSRDLDPSRGIRRLHASGLWLQGVPRANWERYAGPVTLRLHDVARDSGAEIISALDYLCRGDICPALDVDGTPIYQDAAHMRASKVAKLATFFDAVLRVHPRDNSPVSHREQP